MQILSIEPAEPGARSGGASTLVARFEVAMSDDLRLHNLKLLSNRGRYRVYATSTRGQRNATFTPALAAKLTAAALSALKGQMTHDADACTR